MLVTLLGIEMLVKFVKDEKALVPIPVTGRPLITLGMVTAPPKPMYFAIETVPFVVVRVQGTLAIPRAVGRPPKVEPQPIDPGR